MAAERATRKLPPMHPRRGARWLYGMKLMNCSMGSILGYQAMSGRGFGRTYGVSVMSDAPYLAFIRKQPCCMCQASPPSEAHHRTGQRGIGQKNLDTESMPLCHECHMCFHNASGPFKQMDKERRREWQRAQVRHYQDMWTE